MKKNIQKNITIIGVTIIVILISLIFLEVLTVVGATIIGVPVIGLVVWIFIQTNTEIEKIEVVEDEYIIEIERINDDSPLQVREMKTCPVCHTENIVNRKYCKKCNTNIQNITCPVCKTKNPFTNKYCSHCDSILQNKNRY